jgi:hypothetical protein
MKRIQLVEAISRSLQKKRRDICLQELSMLALQLDSHIFTFPSHSRTIAISH